jgi:diacylglycerol kinase (ATP)
MLGFIVNPESGHGAGSKYWTLVKETLQRKQIPFLYKITTGPGQAAGLTCQLIREGCRTVVAVGGDGTIHEVTSALIKENEHKKSLLGVIPAGTGNDFARAHSIPIKPLEALEVILEGHSVTIDMLATETRTAVNSFGTGVDAEIVKMTNEASYKKWLNRIGLGKLSYLISTIRQLFLYKPCTAYLNIDGKTVAIPNMWLTATTNIPYYGGSMKICPHAVPDDGTFDIFVISSKRRWTLITALLSVYSGKHVHHPAVSFYEGKHIQISADRPLLVQVDGEMDCAFPLAISILPGILTVIKPS